MKAKSLIGVFFFTIIGVSFATFGDYFGGKKGGLDEGRIIVYMPIRTPPPPPNYYAPRPYVHPPPSYYPQPQYQQPQYVQPYPIQPIRPIEPIPYKTIDAQIIQPEYPPCCGGGDYGGGEYGGGEYGGGEYAGVIESPQYRKKREEKPKPNFESFQGPMGSLEGGEYQVLPGSSQPVGQSESVNVESQNGGFSWNPMKYIEALTGQMEKENQNWFGQKSAQINYDNSQQKKQYPQIATFPNQKYKN